MGVSSKTIIFIVLIALVCLAIGFIAGRLSKKQHHDGQIIIEPTEDNDRERLIWKLDMELDDIKKKSQITFQVADHTSKKSQLV